MRRRLEGAGIAWRPQAYHKRPRVPATLWDILQGSRVIRQTVRHKKVRIVHCRGDVAMTMVRAARLGDGVRVLYDMRGFFAAERVDSGSWRAGSWIDRSVRRAERANRVRADAIVMLTDRAREALLREGPLPLHRVIPTCVDTTRFRPRPPNVPPDFGLAYVGSLGTWYMAREMAEFSRCSAALLPERPLFLTPDLGEAARAGIDGTWAAVRSLPAEEVPNWLARARALVCFVRPTFSKSASFPTKVGEAWAAGLPVVVNEGIGDLDALVEQHSAGVVLREFGSASYQAALGRLVLLLRDPAVGSRCRGIAETRLSLVEGVRQYLEVYERLLHDRAAPAFEPPPLRVS
jgi:glycosyltransferase involved in cell wall biosynthesis